MGLHYEHLNERVRAHMVEELDLDLEGGRGVYISKRFNERGRELWPELLREALAHGTDISLEEALWANDCFKFHHKGSRVAETAGQTLAEDQFNRYYLRALCRIAQEDGIGQVEVIRAGHVSQPRFSSNALIGALLDVGPLLESLRSNHVSKALGLRPGANSRLSARLP